MNRTLSNPPEVNPENARPRGNKTEPPFCWQAKGALRAISECATLQNQAYALLVYFALTWEASDRNSCSFQVTKGYLARRCGGIGTRSVEYALDGLEELHLIKVDRKPIPGKKANDINTYTLLSLTHTVREGRAPNARGSRTGKASSGAGLKKNIPFGDISREEIEVAPLASGSSGKTGEPQPGATPYTAVEDWRVP